jgi:hypothetical protein
MYTGNPKNNVGTYLNLLSIVANLLNQDIYIGRHSIWTGHLYGEHSKAVLVLLVIINKTQPWQERRLLLSLVSSKVGECQTLAGQEMQIINNNNNK